MAGLMQNKDGEMIGHWHDEVEGPCWSYQEMNIGQGDPDRQTTMCDRGVPIVDNPKVQANASA